jgi:hypothetical protein
MQTAFTLPLQSGRLKENQGAVALRTAMGGTKPFRRADETTFTSAGYEPVSPDTINCIVAVCTQREGTGKPCRTQLKKSWTRMSN